MDKVFPRSFFLTLLTICLCAPVFAQTITIRNFDNGIYGPGSTISVPFHLEDDVLFNQSYSYRLFLSNSSGVYPATPLATAPDFYATYINAVIPASTPAGSGYRLRVVIPDPNNPTGPPLATAETAQFTVSGSTAVTAGMTVPAAEIVRAPDMLGLCSREKTGNYTFTNSSSSGSTANIAIYDEVSRQPVSVPDDDLNPTVAFNADDANYTITVRAVRNGIIGTYSYTLFNRPFYESFGSAGTGTVCLAGGGTLSFNFDIGSPTGLQTNYPGLLYRITWDDGSSTTLSIAEIKAAGGVVSHTYLFSSCGKIVNNQRNVFKVDLNIVGLICDPGLNPTTKYAKVLESPVNRIAPTSPKTGCVGEPVTIVNESATGQHPDATTASCVNANATYTWSIDGVPTYFGYPKSQPFVHAFTDAGQHIITLQIENLDGKLCQSDPVDWPICITNKPVASFTISATACTGNAVSPNTNGTTVDNGSCPGLVNYGYNWTVTPTTGRTISDPSIRNPTITFNQPGIYTVNMSITGACAADATPQIIRVEAQPTATLSDNVTLCGIDVPRTFNETAGPTQTFVTGTPESESPNYRWVITGGDYDFVPPSTQNSRYPTIVFHDEAVYNVSIIHQNSCDPNPNPDDVQVITMRSAPVPIPGTYAPACPGAAIQLNASALPATGITGVEWIGGAGTFSPSRLVADPTYTPSNTERDAGLAEVSFIIRTTITGCEEIPSGVIPLVIKPVNTITSAPSKPICSDNPVNYSPAAASGSTFRWSIPNPPANAVITPGPTSGTQITDEIRNNDPSGQDIEVIYSIIPINDGCEGTPFPFTVIVSPGSTTANFTASQTEGCGPTTITFTAESLSASSIFNWTISNGDTRQGRTFDYEFLPVDDGSGTEKEYTVTLNVNACNPVTPVTIPIRISPATPVALVSAEPDGSCGEVDITVHNLSPGNNLSYDLSLVDAANNPVAPPKLNITTKDDQVFENVQPPITGSTNVFVRLDARDKCGNTSFRLTPAIPLTPLLLVSDVAVDKTEICLGEEVTFINNSTGTAFVYTIYPPNGATPITIPVTNNDNFLYEFSAPGTYEVSITPSSGCGTAAESDRKTVVVYNIPSGDFTQTIANCDNLTYQFTVNGAIDPDYNYTWDFGDGESAVNPTPPPHKYAVPGTYTVMLTVSNIHGCGDTPVSKQITVTAPLVADFEVLPAETIFIPNYHFSFRDRSTGGPVEWQWDFDSSDQAPSTQQNPEVTYSTLDTGYHNITLTIRDNNDCLKTITKRVHITGTPGQLFVPNAFIPTSNITAVNTFMAKGKGIKKWTMEIYNKWGQLVWRTDKLSPEGEPVEGWDGNFRGAPAPQGAYVWQINAVFKNGTEWKGMSYNNSPPKRMGAINLIR